MSGLLAVAPATANFQPSSTDTIVVTGNSKSEIRRQAKAYVRQIGVANGQSQAARWFTAVCPRVFGLNKDQAGRIEARIRAVTKMVGAPLAKTKCEPNLVMVFADDADAMVERLGNSPPGRLGSPGSTAVRRLRTEQVPVRWWYNVSIQSSDGPPGMPDAPRGAKFTTWSGGEGEPPGNVDSATLHHYSASLLSTRSQRGIYAATLVVDSKRIGEVSVRSLADYAALVGLAEVNFGASPDDSILSLFEPSGDRLLSDRDTSFLSGLYRITMDREGHLQRQMLVNEIVRPKTQTAAN
jgi:hypothetical protein